jgi:serine carboxypeptidase-like clade I
MNSKSTFLCLFFTLILQSSAAPASDLVTNLPYYNYTKSRLFSGYLQLKSAPQNQLHYVFVESQKSPASDPLVLWLNGGPGCSSLLGFVQEHGPLVFKENSIEFEENDYSWNKEANMIYLESPVGVGFSKGLYDSYNDDQTANDNLDALLKFLSIFPEYKKNKFYITGESYAGNYIPYLARAVLNYNKQTSDKINLKGILIGNGVADLRYDMDNTLYDFAYEHGLYGIELREQFLATCKRPLDITDEKCNAILDKILTNLESVNIYDIYRNCYFDSQGTNYGVKNKKYPFTPFLRLKLQKFGPNDNGVTEEDKLRLLNTEESSDKKNVKESPPCSDDKGPMWFFGQTAVKQALHVDVNIQFSFCNDTVHERYIWPEIGSVLLYPELLNAGLRVQFYSGDTDMAVPYTGSQKWIDNLKMDVLTPYRDWSIKTGVTAGYVVEYKTGFTFVTIKGVGHMVPQWKRPESYYMFNAYLNQKEL